MGEVGLRRLREGAEVERVVRRGEERDRGEGEGGGRGGIGHGGELLYRE